uniref:Probable prolyl 4-hydroxylase 10 n=1 Tax=Tanacetum cinerariifolium TaxID=118510 RepID=A0A6L2P264_TANCI|nr:probable prolyl 4-hydroxylase 10 [Tanacetum cinerariifolium]
MVFPYLDSTLCILQIPKKSSNSLKAHYRTTVDREDQSVEVLSSEPRAVLFHNFLSPEECDYLISLAKPHMRRAKINDIITGKSIHSSARTCSSMYLTHGRDKTIRFIEKRIADFTSLPVENGEGLQIIHYKVGQMIEAHTDYFTNDSLIKNGGQRLATVLMYLSDLKKVVRRFSLLQRGPSIEIVAKQGYPLNQKRGMHCFSIA